MLLQPQYFWYLNFNCILCPSQELNRELQQVKKNQVEKGVNKGSNSSLSSIETTITPQVNFFGVIA